jgi:hypothetical protein
MEEPKTLPTNDIDINIVKNKVGEKYIFYFFVCVFFFILLLQFIP